ncbi:MAG: DUF3108 domain-containing protein [Geminicoccaceae bacterium]
MRTRAALLLIATFQLMVPRQATAQATDASFVVSWAGLEVGLVELRLAADSAAYRLSWQGRTVGWFGTLFPFEAEGVVAGRVEGTDFRPESFAGRSTSRNGVRQSRVAFGPGGRAMLVDVSADDAADREPVPSELQVAPDPASAALTAVHRAEPGLRLTARSFDGRRALAYDLACGGNAVAAPPAVLACSISARLLAGASGRWRERPPSDADRESIRVWLQRGEDGGYSPVRLEFSSRFGTVMAQRVSPENSPEAG